MASKGKRQKVNFQWTKELGFLIGALVAIIVVTIILAIPTKAEKLATKYNDAIIAASSGENGIQASTIALNEHVFKEFDFEDVEDLKEKINESESYVFVLVGSEKDTVILQNLAVINNKAETCEVETVYICSNAWVKEQTDLLAVEEELLNSEKVLVGADNTEEFTFEEAALLVFDAEGKLVFNSQSIEHITTWDGYITFAFDNFKNKAE